MAEAQRFELWRVTRPYRFSRPTPSTTWVRLQRRDWWTVQDLNPEQIGYEPSALTIELTVQIKWWLRGDLNSRPIGYEPNALPAELHSHVVELKRLELSTS